MKLEFTAKKEKISEAIKAVDNELSKLKISKKEKVRVLFSAELIIENLVENATNNAKLIINIQRFLGTYKLKIQCLGRDINWDNNLNNLFDIDSLSAEEKEVVTKSIEKIYGSNINYKSNKSTNTFTINIAKSQYRELYLTIFGLVAGILFGFAMKNISVDASIAISDNFFGPVYTMFINSMKMIIGPLVFFSIADSISGFSNFGTLGKIASKVIPLYIITSLIAIGVGFVIGNIFPIGDPSLQSLINDAGSSAIESSKTINVSIKDTIIGIIPSDIISPFLKTDMLQIIFIAVIVGIAAAMIGSDSTFSKFIKSTNKVFLKLTSIIVKVLPFAVFCSMAKMMVEMDLSQLAKVVVWVPAVYLGHFSMLFVYAILLLLLSRYNPILFFKRYSPAIMAAFSANSSSAALPVSIKQCKEALKISPKVYGFSIPMGATINMDGSCITFVITAMFAANIFGIDISLSTILALVVTIMSLSVGCPGIPGGTLVCIAILMPVIGVPAETISLIMGLHPLVGMSSSASNVTGDGVVATIVAKSEGLIDLNPSS